MFAQKLFRGCIPSLTLSLSLLFASAPSPVWGNMHDDMHDDMSAVIYKVEFMGNWSADTHPTNFPEAAHFSPIIGGVHNDQVSFWKSGEMASAGLEVVAETGDPAMFRAEVGMEVGMGNVRSVIGPHPVPMPGGMESVSFYIAVSPDFPLVTLVTMIAPSPDWFVGVSGLNLMEAHGDHGHWRESHMVGLFPYDAGTEDGDMFSTDNADTMPQGTIMSAKGMAPFSDQPIATLTFTHMGEAEDVRAVLEQPMEGQLAAGVGLIRGWAFGMDTAVKTVELFIDGQSQGMVSVGSMRGDVGMAYPDAMHAENSGFGLTMNYGTLAPGAHTLTILGTTAMGATFTIKREIMTQRFGGFEFAEAMLADATMDRHGDAIALHGVQFSDPNDPDAMGRTQTIELEWSNAAQGFIVTIITDEDDDHDHDHDHE